MDTAPNPILHLALWIIGPVLCLGGLYVAGLNWAGLVLNISNRKRGIPKRYSQGPVLGPLLGYLGLNALPIQKSPWIWLVLLIDPSTWIVLFAIPFAFRHAGTAHKDVTRGPSDLAKPPEGIKDRVSRVREFFREPARKKRS